MKLTPSAELHLARIADEVGAVGVKLSLTRSGCNGYGYKLDLVEDPSLPNHKVYTFDSVNIFLSTMDTMFLEDVSIDYVPANLGWELKFTNPLEQSACGCGKSFYMK